MRATEAKGCPTDEAVSASTEGSQGSLAARVLAAPLVAAGFLTVIPIPMPRSLPSGSMAWAAACFPLIGGFVGVLLAGADWVLAQWFPPMVVGALLLALSLAITGALHLDGLMDSFDGLFGGRNPASRLAIMRDSRVGSYGVAAGVCFLLLEYAALVSLPNGARGAALIGTLLLSRWAMVVLLWSFPPASATGLAAMMKPEVGRGTTSVATGLAIAMVVGLAGWSGLLMAGLAGAATFLAGRIFVSKLGGITGDSCGATGLVVEATLLLAAVAVL